jgi:hypothetical protein
MTKASPILRLPTELRLHIFRYCLVVDHDIVFNDARDAGNLSRPEGNGRIEWRLLQVCRKFLEEGSHLLYGENSFKSSSRTDSFPLLLQTIGPANAGFVRTLAFSRQNINSPKQLTGDSADADMLDCQACITNDSLINVDLITVTPSTSNSHKTHMIFVEHLRLTAAVERVHQLLCSPAVSDQEMKEYGHFLFATLRMVKHCVVKWTVIRATTALELSGTHLSKVYVVSSVDPEDRFWEQYSVLFSKGSVPMVRLLKRDASMKLVSQAANPTLFPMLTTSGLRPGSGPSKETYSSARGSRLCRHKQTALVEESKLGTGGILQGTSRFLTPHFLPLMFMDLDRAVLGLPRIGRVAMSDVDTIAV